MKFSIIMPTYNCEKYIGEAVKSVLEQTYADFELIIVDDGSTDGTFAICEQIVKGKDNVHLYAVCHGGVSVARNFGLEKACGEYVLFIDCDDTWEKDLLESTANLLDEKSDLVLFGMGRDYYLSDDSFQYSETDLGNSGEAEDLPPDIAPDHLISSYNMASPCNKVYKRAIIQENSVTFCEKCVYLEDLKFNFDFLQHVTNIKVLRSDLYHYRLFTDKKQIFKRNFGEPFVNADEIYVSAVSFINSKGGELKDCNIIVGVLLTAYANQFISSINGKSKKHQVLIIKNLLKNEQFKNLVKSSKNKFFKLFNILSAFGMKALQIKMLKKRYD